MRFSFFIIVAACAICTGCSTTANSRARDAATAQLVTDYLNRQQARINNLNQQYQQVLMVQMAQLSALSVKEFNQQLYTRATSLSEQILLSPSKGMLPGTFAESCYSALQDDYNSLNMVETNLDAARNSYNASFSALKLDVSKLEAIKDSLQSLALTPKQSKDMTLLFSTVYQGYTQAQQQQKAVTTGKAVLK